MRRLPPLPLICQGMPPTMQIPGIDIQGKEEGSMTLAPARTPADAPVSTGQTSSLSKQRPRSSHPLYFAFDQLNLHIRLKVNKISRARQGASAICSTLNICLLSSGSSGSN